MRYALIAGLAVILVAAGCKQKKEEANSAGKPQTLCPVMNQPIKKEFFADYNAKRIYFCHDYCVDAFKADPEKYMKKLRDEGVTLENSPSP
jgi:YHS domain-containing protein